MLADTKLIFHYLYLSRLLRNISGFPLLLLSSTFILRWN